MKILLEILGAVEIHVVVANDEKTGTVPSLVVGIVTKRLFRHSESGFSAFINHVTSMNGEGGVGFITHRRDVLV